MVRLSEGDDDDDAVADLEARRSVGWLKRLNGWSPPAPCAMRLTHRLQARFLRQLPLCRFRRIFFSHVQLFTLLLKQPFRFYIAANMVLNSSKNKLDKIWKYRQMVHWCIGRGGCNFEEFVISSAIKFCPAEHVEVDDLSLHQESELVWQ